MNKAECEDAAMPEPASPARPVAPWKGGKILLSRRVVAMIDGDRHRLYAEPFVGMGGVFFARKRRAHNEVINDISADVANLFRLLQRHYQQLLDVLAWQVCSRAEFERLGAIDPDTLTDLERAVRFLFLQRATYGGTIRSRTFGVSRRNPARFDLTRVVPTLAAAHKRLCGVTIERLPYAAFIQRYGHFRDAVLS